MKVGLIEQEFSSFINYPMVTVIIATYRRDTSLKQALLSIGHQTYNNVEIVIVDDNADKEWNRKVENIVTNIKDHIKYNIIYIKNNQNQGSAETRNIGINAANGDYITFLDDDDVYLTKKIERQIMHMLDEESDFSITDLELYNEEDKLVEKRTRNYIKGNVPSQLLKYHVLYHMTGTDTFMFKTEYLKNLGGFPKIDIGDEFYLMQKAIEKCGKFSYLPECHVKAYIHFETQGLSSGVQKILGENLLFAHKKKLFNNLNPKEIRYVKMRHYAVIAFAELRQKNFFEFALNSLLSFLSSPFQCLNLFLSRK